MIILLTEEPNIIAARRLRRDGVIEEIPQITAFQESEKAYAIEIAEELGIPLEITSGVKDIIRVVDYIRQGGC